MLAVQGTRIMIEYLGVEFGVNAYRNSVKITEIPEVLSAVYIPLARGLSFASSEVWTLVETMSNNIDNAPHEVSTPSHLLSLCSLSSQHHNTVLSSLSL